MKSVRKKIVRNIQLRFPSHLRTIVPDSLFNFTSMLLKDHVPELNWRLESLMTSSDGQAEDVLLMWRLGRMITTSQLVDAPTDLEAGLPGLSAFYADLHPHRQATINGYLLLIPSSLTDCTVLNEMTIRLVRTSHALGDNYTIITGDQATYELHY